MAGGRVLVAVGVLALVALGTWLYRRWHAAPGPAAGDGPLVPPALLGGGDRTWVVFTTPYCATCGPVEDHLRSSDPGAQVVKVDATRRPDLAGAFHVRRAPTVLLADARGEVQARLVGADAVRRHLAAPA